MIWLIKIVYPANTSLLLVTLEEILSLVRPCPFYSPVFISNYYRETATMVLQDPPCPLDRSQDQ